MREVNRLVWETHQKQREKDGGTFRSPLVVSRTGFGSVIPMFRFHHAVLVSVLLLHLLVFPFLVMTIHTGDADSLSVGRIVVVLCAGL